MSGLRLSEGAAVIGGEGGAGLVSDASTRHAHVLRVDDDGDILSVELELQRLDDLTREPLLYLRACEPGGLRLSLIRGVAGVSGTCGRRAKWSTTLLSLESPITLPEEK